MSNLIFNETRVAERAVMRLPAAALTLKKSFLHYSFHPPVIDLGSTFQLDFFFLIHRAKTSVHFESDI